MGPEPRREREKESLSPFHPAQAATAAPSLWSSPKASAIAPAAAADTSQKAAESPGFLSSLWSGAKHAGSKLYHDLTAWNFEGRDAHNGHAPTQDEISQDPSWRLMGPKETIYHDNNKGAAERKYVKDDPSSLFGLGGKEAVIDGDTGKAMEAGPYQATYNYCNPAKGGIKDLSLEGVARNVGHFALDVVPYWFGGTVRGDEGTTAGQRVLGPENYQKASEAWAGAKNWVGDKASSVGKTLKASWGGLSDWFGSKDNDHDADKQHVQ